MEAVEILNEPIATDQISKWVSSPQAGGINVFIGTVRQQTNGKKVIRLEFEAYQPMALKEMGKIIIQAKTKWPILKMAIHHRVGTLLVGEVAVAIAVSTPHRLASFQACQFAIDTLKQTVPIWKKEVFEDGEQWVAAHP